MPMKGQFDGCVEILPLFLFENSTPTFISDLQVSWSPDGRMLLAASFDATTSVWENVNGAFSPTAALEGHEHEVKAAVFDSSGVYVATCSRDKSVWIWEMDQGEFDCVSVLHGHSQDVKSVVWHPTEVGEGGGG